MAVWIRKLHRRIKRSGWWFVILMVLKIIEDRLAGSTNTWIDDHSGEFALSIKKILDWSAQDTLGIAGVLLIGTFIGFMALSYFQKSEADSIKLDGPTSTPSQLSVTDRFVFAVVVFSIVGLIGYDLLKSNDHIVGGFIQMENMGVPGPPLLTVGVRNYINVRYINRGTAPVSGAGQVTTIVFVAPSQNAKDLDTEVFNQAREVARSNREAKADREGVTLGIGQTIWTTVAVDFSDDDIRRLMEGTASLYIIGHAFWNEHPGQMDKCFKLQPPKYHPLKESDIVWHHCDTKKINK